MRDLGRVSEWCDLWRMKLNASITNTMIVSRSRTMHPSPVPPINYWGVQRSLMSLIDILGVRIWFQDDLWEVSSFSFQSSFSKTWYLEEVLASIPRLIASLEMLSGFVLPVLEYCSVVWSWVDDTHLKQLDRVVSRACFVTGRVFVCDIAHRRSVALLCMLYKIRCNPMHRP